MEKLHSSGSIEKGRRLSAVGVPRLWILLIIICSCGLSSTVLSGQEEEEPLRDRLRRLESEQEAQKEALRRQGEEIERLRAELEGRERGEPEASETSETTDGGSLFEPPGVWQLRGDTRVTAYDLVKHLSLGFGIQYRLLYNAANLPGPGGTTFSDTEDYDFMRQRLRLNLAVAPRGIPVGGLIQSEFRGGFGGSSPNASDPRSEEPTLNPFNQLQARGIRYGYLFADLLPEQRFIAGILPLSDEFGDTLFSSDWDFNVGGGALLGAHGPSSYRLGYLRLIEGVGASDADTVAEDGALVMVDYVHNLSPVRLGMHVYYLLVGEGLPLGDTEELWIGPSLGVEVGALALKGFSVVNVGRLGEGELDGEGQVLSGFETNDGHTGYAFKLEASHPLGPLELSLQALFSSGDSADDVEGRFVTLQGLFRTEGYWAYTHLFTANPASDVNDLAVELGNGGAGLWTLQGRGRLPIVEWLSAEVFAGWFRASRSRIGSRDMGIEVGALLSFLVGKGFRLDVGSAGAFLGDFFGRDAEDLYEVFVRIQYEF